MGVLGVGAPPPPPGSRFIAYTPVNQIISQTSEAIKCRDNFCARTFTKGDETELKFSWDALLLGLGDGNLISRRVVVCITIDIFKWKCNTQIEILPFTCLVWHHETTSLRQNFTFYRKKPCWGFIGLKSCNKVPSGNEICAQRSCDKANGSRALPTISAYPCCSAHFSHQGRRERKLIQQIMKMQKAESVLPAAHTRSRLMRRK